MRYTEVVLVKMCQKLAKDDENIKSSLVDISKFDMKALMFSLLGVGGTYALWSNRHWLGTNVRKLLNKAAPHQQQGAEKQQLNGGNGNNANNNYYNANNNNNNMDMEVQARRLLEAREARLKRFAEINANSVQDNPNPVQIRTLEN